MNIYGNKETLGTNIHLKHNKPQAV